MKTANIMKAVCVAGLAATCVWGLAACADGASASGTKTYTGGVAATVNGTEIPEDEVTGMVESIRSQMSMTDADTWGQWLADNAMKMCIRDRCWATCSAQVSSTSCAGACGWPTS